MKTEDLDTLNAELLTMLTFLTPNQSKVIAIHRLPDCGESGLQLHWKECAINKWKPDFPHHCTVSRRKGKQYKLEPRRCPLSW